MGLSSKHTDNSCKKVDSAQNNNQEQNCDSKGFKQNSLQFHENCIIHQFRLEGTRVTSSFEAKLPFILQQTERSSNNTAQPSRNPTTVRVIRQKPIDNHLFVASFLRVTCASARNERNGVFRQSGKKYPRCDSDVIVIWPT